MERGQGRVVRGAGQCPTVATAPAVQRGPFARAIRCVWLLALIIGIALMQGIRRGGPPSRSAWAVPAGTLGRHWLSGRGGVYYRCCRTWRRS